MAEEKRLSRAELAAVWHEEAQTIIQRAIDRTTTAYSEGRGPEVTTSQEQSGPASRETRINLSPLVAVIAAELLDALLDTAYGTPDPAPTAEPGSAGEAGVETAL